MVIEDGWKPWAGCKWDVIDMTCIEFGGSLGAVVVFPWRFKSSSFLD